MTGESKFGGKASRPHLRGYFGIIEIATWKRPVGGWGFEKRLSSTANEDALGNFAV